MELMVQILFLIFATFSTVHGNYDNLCPTSTCGSQSISYPFKLPNLEPQNNYCSYTNLTCDSTNQTTTLQLPYAGDFHVSDIYYYTHQIQLDDPGNCLMGRLMKNLNLSSSPFEAVDYENYTFYTCPSDSEYMAASYVYPIDCLSNSTNSTMATATIMSSDDLLSYDCRVIGSWMLPVRYSGQFEYGGISSSLYLTWNLTTCVACEQLADPPGDEGGSNKNFWSNLVKSPFFFPSFVAMVILFTIFLLQIIREITLRNESDPVSFGLPVSAIAATTPCTAGGLDESKMNSCTKLVVLSESRVNPGPYANTCSICLDSYHPQELVRSIAKCEHCFHAFCIEQWLTKNVTCPICRTVLSDVDL